MQIEEGFRDVKSPQFGLGFGMHQSRQGKRIEILLLIAMLANVVVMVAGLQVRDSGQQRRYQSNTIRHRNVLSVWRLGLEWLRRHCVGAVPWPSWKTVLTSLQGEFKGQALGMDSKVRGDSSGCDPNFIGAGLHAPTATHLSNQTAHRCHWYNHVIHPHSKPRIPCAERPARQRHSFLSPAL